MAKTKTETDSETEVGSEAEEETSKKSSEKKSSKKKSEKSSKKSEKSSKKSEKSSEKESDQEVSEEVSDEEPKKKSKPKKSRKTDDSDETDSEAAPPEEVKIKKVLKKAEDKPVEKKKIKKPSTEPDHEPAPEPEREKEPEKEPEREKEPEKPAEPHHFPIVKKKLPITEDPKIAELLKPIVSLEKIGSISELASDEAEAVLGTLRNAVEKTIGDFKSCSLAIRIFDEYYNRRTLDFIDCLVGSEIGDPDTIKLESIEKLPIGKSRETVHFNINEVYPIFGTIFQAERFFIKKQCSAQGVTDSWLKMYEILNHFRLKFPFGTNVFCNCELPGSFLYAINHYFRAQLRIKYQWYAMSLEGSDKDGNKAFGDDFGLKTKYPANWLNDSSHRGDVTDPETHEYIKSKLVKKIDLYTGDGSFETIDEVEPKGYTWLFIGQLIDALNVLKLGGTMILKMMFPAFSKQILSILYKVSKVFGKLNLCKPVSSMPESAETYLVGISYLGVDDDFLTKLEAILKNNKKSLVVDEIPKSFYRRIVDTSYEMFQRQHCFIEEDLKYLGKKEDISMSYRFTHEDPEVEFRFGLVKSFLKGFFIPILRDGDKL